MTDVPKQTCSADNGGLRDDKGKTEFHLLPLDGISELARVYTFGAQKYAPRNWERGMLWSRCYNSLLRHLHAYWMGERNDQETGLHHMAHVAWNAIALLVYSLRGIGIDDRALRIMEADKSECAQQNVRASTANARDFMEANAPELFVERKSDPALEGLQGKDRIDAIQKRFVEEQK